MNDDFNDMWIAWRLASNELDTPYTHERLRGKFCDMMVERLPGVLDRIAALEALAVELGNRLRGLKDAINDTAPDAGDRVAYAESAAAAALASPLLAELRAKEVGR